jgi:hypothetical protein
MFINKVSDSALFQPIWEELQKELEEVLRLAWTEDHFITFEGKCDEAIDCLKSLKKISVNRNA